MKTLIPSLLLLAPIGAFAADDAGVGLGFEVGTSYYIPAQKPNNKGMGNFFAVNLNLSSIEVGYYFEALNLKMKADDDNNVGTADRIDADININAIRVIKPIIKEVGIGLAVGYADITGRVQGAPAVTFSQLAPVADIFARITPISGGDKVKASVNVLLGYRFIVIDTMDPDNAAGGSFQDPVDNFNGFRIGLSAGIAF